MLMLAVLSACALIWAASGHADAKTKPHTITLAYDIFGRGFKVMSFKLNVVLTGNKYLATTKLQTTGFASLFSSINARMEVAGLIDKSKLSPVRFQMSIKKKKGTKTASVSWRENGTHKIRQRPQLSARKEAEVRRTLKAGFPDPLSALLSLALINTDKPCRQASRVFDGRKIFDLAFTYTEPARVGTQDLEYYQGTAHRCTMKDQPIAGYSRKKMKRIKEKPPQPLSIWLAPILDSALERDILIPILITGQADWINISIRLTQADIDGQPLKSFSLARN